MTCQNINKHYRTNLKQQHKQNIVILENDTSRQTKPYLNTEAKHGLQTSGPQILFEQTNIRGKQFAKIVHDLFYTHVVTYSYN